VCRRSGGFGGDLEEESDDRRAGVFAALAVVAAAALARGEREQRLEQAVSRHVAADLTVRLSSLKQVISGSRIAGFWDPRIVWSCSVAG
jgi:hypothetical protein